MSAPIQPTFTVDTSGLREVMASLRDAMMRGDAKQRGFGQTLVTDEAKRLTQKIVKITKPANNKHGQSKVRKDLESLFKEADGKLLEGVIAEAGTKEVNVWRNLGGKRVNLVWGHVATTEAEMRRLHLLSRNRQLPKSAAKGQNKWVARVVVPKGIREKYIRRMENRTGRWKSAWVEAGAQLGLKAPAFVTKHRPSPFAVANISGASNPVSPEITLGSRAPGTKSQDALVVAMVHDRAESMRRRLKLVLSGFKRQISRGMKRLAIEEGRYSHANASDD